MTDTTNHQLTEERSLVLAAEECRPELFDAIHKFSDHDQRTIRKLRAHGPVLLQGGRGTGKSAFMIAASRQMAPHSPDSDILGLYVSLRYVPLLKATGDAYERLFCQWVSGRIQHSLADTPFEFSDSQDLAQLKANLSELSKRADRRVVLLFDDAAHIGRETSLGVFFDIFRTLSSDSISCKAAIYPGVTEFGTRFDVYNDASLIDVLRSPEQAGFSQLFLDILTSRYPILTGQRVTGFSLHELAAFVGSTVLGNVRGFVFAVNDLLDHLEQDAKIGYTAVGQSLLRLAATYYWPLLEEVRPKLGRYAPAVEAAHEIADTLFQACASTEAQSVIVHRKLVARYAKPFEILEYAGFLTRREASRALKSGGRGPRFAVNLCNLLEQTAGSRLTAKLFENWLTRSSQTIELHERGEQFANIPIPEPDPNSNLEILQLPVSLLRKSPAYPYGLTERKLDVLQNAGIRTIGELAEASDDDLLSLEGVGPTFLDRFRSVVSQAIWM